MSKLTDAEKAVVERLGNDLYTVDFIENWISRDPVNVFVNAPAALQQMGVNGYLEAVRMIVKMEGLK